MSPATALTRTRETAAARLRRWYIGHDFLFVSYSVFLGVIYVSSSHQPARRYFLLAVLPLALLAAIALARPQFAGAARPRIPVAALARQVFVPLASWVFWAIVLYVAALAVPVWFQADIEPRLAEIQSKRALEVLLFLAVTAFLVVRYQRFMPRLLLLFGSFAAASTLANMLLYAFQNRTNPLEFLAYRFAPLFGLQDLATIAALAYALMLVAAVAAAVTETVTVRQRFVLLLQASIFLIALLWTNARASYLAAFAGIAASVVTMLTRRQVALAAAGVGLAAAAALAHPLARQALLGRGDSYRLEVWRHYLKMAAERPIFGFSTLRDTQMVAADGFHVIHPHNLFLSAQLYAGVLGAAALLAAIVAGIYWSIAYCRRTGSAVPLALITALIAAGLTDFYLIITPPNWTWVTLWLPIGICIGAEVSVREARSGLAAG